MIGTYNERQRTHQRRDVSYNVFRLDHLSALLSAIQQTLVLLLQVY